MHNRLSGYVLSYPLVQPFAHQLTRRALDAAHNLPLRPLTPPSPATRIRLAYTLLTAPTIQHGLGITPAKGQWERVKSIAPLHDEERDREWVRSWSMGKGEWGIGLWRGLEGDTTGIAEHVSGFVFVLLSS